MAYGLSTRRGVLGRGAAVAAAAWGVCAAACAGGQQGGGSTQDVARSLQPQSLEFWGPDPKVLPAMQLVTDAFSARYPNLTVNVAGGPLNITPESQAKFLTAIAAGTAPDVTYQDRYIPRSYSMLDAVVSLDDRVRRSKVKPDEWWPNLKSDVTQGGKLFGLPVHTDARLFSWNKAYFRDLGVDPEKAPATWDDVASISARMVHRGADGKLERAGFMPWGGGFHTGGLSFFLHLWQANGETLAADERKPRFQEPPGVKALDWMMACARQIGGSAGYKELSTGISNGPGLDVFSVGRLGMQIHGITVWPDYVKNVPQLEFGLAEVPIPQGGKTASYTGGFATCLSKSAPHADAGWAFMEHWQSDEMQFAWPDKLQAVPAVHRVAESEAFVKADPIPQYRLRDTANKAVRSARWVPTRPGSSDLIDLWINSLTKASDLTLSAQDTLSEMARQTQLILDRWYDKYKV
jgi:multiple sugar transport system substrate-binding protein